VQKCSNAALRLSQGCSHGEVLRIGLLDSFGQVMYVLFFLLQLSLQVLNLPAA
jgi:hypothetical protein